MQSLISIVPKILDDKFNTISINLIIKNNWNKMFDNGILQLIQFDKAIVSTIGENSVLNVVIKIIGCAVMAVKAKLNSIKKSIQLLTGISKINIILHQISGLDIKKKVKQCL